MKKLWRVLPCLLLWTLSASILIGCSCSRSTPGIVPDAGLDGSVDGGPDGSMGLCAAPCAANAVCVSGTCIAGNGACTTDDDCGGDTYCCDATCLSDPEDAPTCIPYGTGPRGDVNELCVGNITIGLFQADVQCEWTGPPPGDPFPNHVQVLATPMVADLPFDSGAAKEIVIVTYNGFDGGAPAAAGTDPAFFGVIRILNGQTCEQLATLDDPANRIIAASPPALGDLNGDGLVDIVTHRATPFPGHVEGLIAYVWNGLSESYERLWATTDTDISGQRWDGPAIHDLNNGGAPEVISGTEVYDGLTGTRLNDGQVLPGGSGGTGKIAVVGNLDGDDEIEIVAQDVYEWDSENNVWTLEYTLNLAGNFWAYADFGTPGATPAEFDSNTPDGIAEVVMIGAGTAKVITLGGQVLLDATGLVGGGPPTVGDFDDDGRPEVASAGRNAYRILDLDCATDASCETTAVRWSAASQDFTSNKTGSSIFDFEGDGAAEAVYADECFARIYEGSTGEVLYSAFRTSCTWYENPVIADPDGDQNTEILIGSNANCSVLCPAIDPIHRGNRCEATSDCLSGVCGEGYCRCTNDGECREGYSCQDPLAGTPGTGKTCRAFHPPGVGQVGLRVLRDQLDRWASSRPMWNQHAYSVTNINDDGSIPLASEWVPNYTDPDLNNFRQNVQGEAAPGSQPDITGDIGGGACRISGETITLTATVCNRGTRTVGAAMPATFYQGDPADENVLCVSYTEGPVPIGECLDVSCEITGEITGTVTMIVNDDGMGGKTTVECNENNNDDDVLITGCVS